LALSGQVNLNQVRWAKLGFEQASAIGPRNQPSLPETAAAANDLALGLSRLHGPAQRSRW
jgi:hypothetical protein